jgi:hypothetical protein
MKMTKVVIQYHNLELLEKYAESRTYEVCAMLIGNNEKNIFPVVLGYGIV